MRRVDDLRASKDRALKDKEQRARHPLRLRWLEVGLSVAAKCANQPK